MTGRLISINNPFAIRLAMRLQSRFVTEQCNNHKFYNIMLSMYHKRMALSSGLQGKVWNSRKSLSKESGCRFKPIQLASGSRRLPPPNLLPGGGGLGFYLSHSFLFLKSLSFGEGFREGSLRLMDARWIPIACTLGKARQLFRRRRLSNDQLDVCGLH